MRRFFFLFTTLLLCSFLGYGQNKIAANQQDSLALVALYNSTDGTNWTNKTNWLTDKVSTWNGITLDEATGRVTKIELSENNLNGDIPTEIGNLIELKTLSLELNNLKYSIPAEIKNLTNLEFLDLSNNDLSGSLPDDFSNLTKLKTLYLSHNTFWGTTLEIKYLTNLEYLDISNNSLHELLDFSGITKLKGCNVSNNIFTFKDLSDGNITATEYYTYSPQKPLDVTKTESNNIITLTCENEDVTNNKYQWFKDNTELSGKTDKVLSINSNEIGTYICKVTNIGFQELTLETSPIEIKIQPTVNEQDSLALVAFYNATNGDIWKDNTNWKKDKVHTWNGITLDETGRVSSISLRDNNLTGSLPAEIGNLTNLNSLDLRSNKIRGIIPIEIENLKNLKRLILGNNLLVGNIPTQIGELDAIELLDLSNNGFSGTIPAEIGNLTNLKFIRLSENRLNGTLPIEFANLINLTTINIEDNNLTDLTDLSALTKLKSIYIVNNYLNFAKLKAAKINSQYYRYTPQHKIKLSKTEADNQVTLSAIVDDANNEYKWFVNSRIISGKTNKTLTVSKAEIGYYYCEVTNPDFPDLTLTNIPVKVSNPANTQDSLALVALYNATDGANWTKKDNWLTGEVSSWHGITLDETGKVTNISLFSNNLNGSLPSEIGNFENLKILKLGSNNLIGNIPTEIGNLSNLVTLHLYSNKLSYEIPTEIGNLKKLCELWIYENQFSGNIPAEIGNMTELFTILLSKNKLTGTIPAEIGNLTKLTMLQLNENELSGEIPTELNNLTKLQFLYLNKNKFTQLPNLSALTTLVWCHIEDNAFDFGDLETANITATTYKYYPQAKITLNQREEGNNIIFSCNAGGTGDTYNWYKGESYTQGAITNEFIINKNAGGIYYARGRNANFPNLIIETERITVETFDIIATANIGGFVSGSGEYAPNSTVKLFASPNGNYEFTNWTENGIEVSTDITYTFTVTKNRTLVANFAKKKVEITATANLTEGGTITGNQTYEIGATAELVATANENYNFVNWTEDGTEVSTETTYSFTVSTARTLVANFEKKTFEITATVNPTEGGTITGNKTYEIGATAELVATANENYNFVNWTENGTEVSTETTYSFTVSEARTLVANFAKKTVEITATANPTEGGTITGNQTYEIGATATLKATANEGYIFVNWTEAGTEVSTEATYSFTVSEARTLVANFKLDNAAISDEDTNSEIKLYPNPAKDILNIQYDDLKNAKLSLFDFSGKKQNIKILNKNSNQIKIDISDKKAGVYFLQILIDNKIIKTSKFIVIK